MGSTPARGRTQAYWKTTGAAGAGAGASVAAGAGPLVVAGVTTPGPVTVTVGWLEGARRRRPA